MMDRNQQSNQCSQGGGTPSPTDTTKPTLSSFTPADNSTSVAVNSNLVLSFSESVVAGAGTIVIHAANGSVVSTISAADTSQVTISGGTVTINPSSDLAQGTSYYITIGGDAFRAKPSYQIGEPLVGHLWRLSEAKPLPCEQGADDEVSEQIGVGHVLGEHGSNDASHVFDEPSLERRSVEQDEPKELGARLRPRIDDDLAEKAYLGGDV